jgi:hypothetical protein
LSQHFSLLFSVKNHCRIELGSRYFYGNEPKKSSYFKCGILFCVGKE